MKQLLNTSPEEANMITYDFEAGYMRAYFDVCGVSYVVETRRRTLGSTKAIAAFYAVIEGKNVFTVSGTGNAVTVIRRVVEALRHLSKTEGYTSIEFTANKDEKSRVALYKRLCQRYARDFVHKPTDYEHIFEVKV